MGLIVLTFWPLLIFWNDIEFSKARFTEEWIKLCFSGVILYIVIEKIKDAHVDKFEKQYVSNTIEYICLNNLRYIYNVLSGVDNEFEKQRHEILLKWEEIVEEVRNFDFSIVSKKNNIILLREIKKDINAESLKLFFGNIKLFKELEDKSGNINLIKRIVDKIEEL